MFSFFRNIRKGLSADNKPVKYLRYAIGEIILIVIGILIALSINNWNENQSRKQLEHQLLLELKENLSVDLKSMEYNKNIHESIIHAAQEIVKVLDKEVLVSDSLEYHFSRVILVPLLFPTTSAYYNIKENGTNIIANDQLRFAVIELYEKYFSILKQWIDSEREKQNNDIREFYRSRFRSIEYFGRTQPFDLDKLLQDQQYYSYIKQQIEMTNYSVALYATRIRFTEEVLKMLDEELAQFDK